MQALHGSLVALVTPMSPNGDVDYASLEKLIEWHIANKTNGIVSVGTTGESSTLNPKEHLDVIDFTVRHVKNRIPVIAGTGANSTQEAIELTEESRKLGSDYALLVTPYYNKPNQRGLIAHYEAIADAVDIPQILYNVPSRTACDLLPSSVQVLSEHKNIVGIKEALDCMDRIKELVEVSDKAGDNFLIFSGDDPTFMESLVLGTHGVISVAANIIPKSISDICSMIEAGKFIEAKELNFKNNELFKLLFIESNPIPAKWMLYRMGLIQNAIRLPLTELDETYQDDVMSEIKQLGLL